MRRSSLAPPVGAVLALLAMTAHAVVSINEPWLRVAPDGRNAEVYLNLRSSEPLVLAGVDSFAARRVSIRTAAGTTVRSIDLPANVVVALRPAQTRIGLTGLVRRIRMGEFVPLTLFLRDANGLEQKLFVNAEVRLHSPTEDETSGHGHSHESHSHGKSESP